MKSILMMGLLLLPILGTAKKIDQPIVQPIIQLTVYSDYHVDLRSFGKPVQIIAGAEDECNGGFFPDDYRFKNFTIRKDGLIREVYLQPKNGLIFYGEKLDANTTEARFKRQFKGKFTPRTEGHTYAAMLGEDESKSIVFYFKNGTLQKYSLWVDDC